MLIKEEKDTSINSVYVSTHKELSHQHFEKFLLSSVFYCCPCQNLNLLLIHEADKQSEHNYILTAYDCFEKGTYPVNLIFYLHPNSHTHQIINNNQLNPKYIYQNHPHNRYLPTARPFPHPMLPHPYEAV